MDDWGKFGVLSFGIDQLEAWTVEDAQNADREWRNSNREGPSPLSQWHAWKRTLPDLRKRYEDHQDSKVLFEALETCFRNRLPMPAWCGQQVHDSFIKIERHEARSWDEVFGKPHPGVNLHNAKKREGGKALNVVHDALELIDRGEPVEKTLRSTAEQHDISYEQARKFYYDHLKAYPTCKILASDGWYQKKTGEPDTAYKKIRYTEGDDN